MAMEQRYFGKVKAVNTTPSCLTIIPEDRNARPDYDRACGLSRIQLADFLYAFGSGEKDSAANMRVSYVLRPGPGGMMLVQDVQRVEAVKVKQEYGPSESGYGAGEGRVKHWKVGMLELWGRIGFVADDIELGIRAGRFPGLPVRWYEQA